MVKFVARGLLMLGWAATLGAATSQAQPATGKKYALLVGMNKYESAQVQELKYAKNDIDELKRVLDEQGYDVRVVADDSAYRHRIISALTNLALRATEADTFILYYAGHGVRNVEVNQKTYWLTYAAQLNLLDLEGIRVEHLLDYVRDIRAGRKLILLDHCFAGDVVELVPGRTGSPSRGDATPAPPGGARDGPVGSGRLERVALPVDEFKLQVRVATGTTVLAAARGPAYELDELRHGVFTAAILEACTTRHADTDKNAKLSVVELGQYARTRVAALLKRQSSAQDVIGFSDEDPANPSWDVCSLPVADQEALKRAAAYKNKIREWQLKDWLTSVAVFNILDVILKWEQANGDTSQLSDADQRSLSQIREALEPTRPDIPERPRAEALKIHFDTGGL